MRTVLLLLLGMLVFVANCACIDDARMVDSYANILDECEQLDFTFRFANLYAKHMPNCATEPEQNFYDYYHPAYQSIYRLNTIIDLLSRATDNSTSLPERKTAQQKLLGKIIAKLSCPAGVWEREFIDRDTQIRQALSLYESLLKPESDDQQQQIVRLLDAIFNNYDNWLFKDTV